MFNRATAFNQNISSWDTRKVANFSNMFVSASTFNQPIGSWITTAASNISGMFNSATAFNQDINSWTTSGVTNMNTMFNNASAFNQSLGSWILRTAGVTMSNMLDNCGMSTENYSRTLIGWANSVSSRGNLPSVTNFGVSGRTYNCINYVTGQTYTNAVAARTYLDLAPANWTFNGGDTQTGAPC
jgi:surface protein